MSKDTSEGKNGCRSERQKPLSGNMRKTAGKAPGFAKIHIFIRFFSDNSALDPAGVEKNVSHFL